MGKRKQKELAKAKRKQRRAKRRERMSKLFDGFSDIVKYGKWAAQNAQVFSALFDFPEKWQAATTPLLKLEVVQWVLETIKPAIATLPPPDAPDDGTVVTTMSEHALNQMVVAAGLDWAKLLALLPVLIPLLKQIWEILNAPKT
jgi:hypothetical protein